MRCESADFIGACSGGCDKAGYTAATHPAHVSAYKKLAQRGAFIYFVMTLCWSRHQYAEVVLDQTVETWLACHRRAFEWFGGCPGRVIIDNAKCAIIRHCMHSPEVQRSYAGLAEAYSFRIDPCPPLRIPRKENSHSRAK
jgi:transposase